MEKHSLDDRIEILEQRMASLSELPDRVAGLESQLSQFRGETRMELSAVRRNMTAEFTALRHEIRDGG